jgi:uncharacterized protein (DUF58 family)
MSAVFDYKTTALVSGLMLGSHKSRQRGTGSDFYKKSLFLDEPDTSRIDLNASLTDPFESLHVKTFRQRSKIDVLVLVDGSSSMLYGDKINLVAQLFDSIQESVHAASDNFYGYLLTQQLHAINDSDELRQQFAAVTPEHNHAEAYLQVNQVTPGKPALVFVISDFHWPEQQLQSLMTGLSAHLVVPVIIWHSSEYTDYPLWRFIELTDLETGKPALVFITPTQRAAIQQRYQQREAQLQQQFRHFNQRPFWLIDQYSVQDMSRYFATQ